MKKDFINRTIERLTGHYGIPKTENYNAKLYETLSDIWDNKFWQDNHSSHYDDKHSVEKQAETVAKIMLDSKFDHDDFLDIISQISVEINDPEIEQTADNWQGDGCKNYDDSQDVCLDENARTNTVRSAVRKIIKEMASDKAIDDMRNNFSNSMHGNYIDFYAKELINEGDYPKLLYRGVGEKGLKNISKNGIKEKTMFSVDPDYARMFGSILIEVKVGNPEKDFVYFSHIDYEGEEYPVFINVVKKTLYKIIKQ